MNLKKGLLSIFLFVIFIGNIQADTGRPVFVDITCIEETNLSPRRVKISSDQNGSKIFINNKTYQGDLLIVEQSWAFPTLRHPHPAPIIEINSINYNARYSMGISGDALTAAFNNPGIVIHGAAKFSINFWMEENSHFKAACIGSFSLK